ncbi:MAG TPA: LamG domain-containing protein [Candidatus Nanopelagicales bacterium]|nr:LamG domain-containing protein [Candidatus Nanopelagicales bacterium]
MRARRSTVAGAVLGLAMAGLAVVAPGPVTALGSTVPAVTSSSWQTNGKVRAIAPAGGLVFLGGEFTKVRPPGAAAGTSETSRTYLAAVTASTGALVTTFNHSLNGIVRALATSTDRTTVYVGGDFTTVDGKVRNHLAAFDVATGALTAWAPSSSHYVNALAASPTRIYVGGNFTTLAGVATTRLGAVTTAGAGGPAFRANADNVVYAIAVSPAYDKLFVGGAFQSFNGDTTYHGAASASAATGATLPMPAISTVPVYATTGCMSVSKVVVTNGTKAYFGNEGSGSGCFDGTWAVNIADGTLAWRNGCLGATQGLTVLNNRMYVGSHAHDCSANTKDPDAFPEVGSVLGLGRHLMAYDTATGFASSWYPNTNGGPGGAGLGPRVLATDGSQIFVGGEFTSVNGQGQQGFARFAPLASGASARPGTPAQPRAAAIAGGGIAVSVQAPVDNDDTDLVVRLYRDGGTTPIQTRDVHSLFWRRPVVTFVDTGVAVGTAHTYTADVVEKTGPQASPKSVASPSVTARATLTSYPAAVAADAPTFFWRLGENAGPVAADTSPGALGGGTYANGISYGAAGPVSDATAVTTDGAGGLISSNQTSAPTAFSVEAWFRTTTTRGGKIIGFGDRASGFDADRNTLLSKKYDRHVYMTNAGKLVFGVRNSGGSRVELVSSKAYNDGAWHQVVGTQGAAGLRLYVDGVQVATNATTSNQVYKGFWRVGGDATGGWSSSPSSPYLAGTIANVAVYPTALSLTRVQAHWTASGRSL